MTQSRVLSLKFLVGLVMVLAFPLLARSQWVVNGSDIHYSDGNVSVGTTSSGTRFSIVGGTVGGGAFDGGVVPNPGLALNSPETAGSYIKAGINFGGNLTNSFVYNYSIAQYDSNLLFGTANMEKMRITSNGDVGIGTRNPGTRLSITGGTVGGMYDGGVVPNPGLALNSPETAGSYIKAGINFGGNLTNSFIYNYSIAQYDSSLLFGTANMEKMRITSGGNVGIGTADPVAKLHVVGDVTANHFNGILNATYQDVAEWVPSSKSIAVGTVVIVDAEIDNQVLPSSTAYDTRVAGVVSDSPGVLLGVAGEGKVKVATTGRVKVKVDASRGAIRKGDLLVTSDKEGVAMKSEPVEVAGVSMHRPGTLVGKALQSLEEGEGEILVLLSLQ